MDRSTRRTIIGIRILIFGLFILVIGTCLISTFTDISVENVPRERAKVSGLPVNASRISLYRPSMISGKTEVFLEFDTDETSFEEWKGQFNQDLKSIKDLPIKINRYNFSDDESYTYEFADGVKYAGIQGRSVVEVAFDRGDGRAFMHTFAAE